MTKKKEHSIHTVTVGEADVSTEREIRNKKKIEKKRRKKYLEKENENDMNERMNWRVHAREAFNLWRAGVKLAGRKT